MEIAHYFPTSQLLTCYASLRHFRLYDDAHNVIVSVHLPIRHALSHVVMHHRVQLHLNNQYLRLVQQVDG